MKKSGSNKRDVLVGTGDYDWLFGMEGSDDLLGGDGHDYLVGGTGSNKINGGKGNDVIFAREEIVLSRSQESWGVTLAVNSDKTVDLANMQGGDGNDIIIGFGQADAGAGNDFICGGNGHGGGVTGGAGNDTYLNTSCIGGGDIGNDLYIISERMTAIDGEGNNRFVIDGNFAGDVYLGTLGKGDVIEFRNVTGITSLNAILDRESDMPGFLGNDIEIAIDDDTTVRYSTLDFYDDQGNLISEAPPKYEINKTNVDGIVASINNRVAEMKDAKVSALTSGSDGFSGQSGKDIVKAGRGDDRVNGGGGNDDIQGEDGNDRLDGSDGNDRIEGGNGRDVMSGGAGADTFAYLSAQESGKTGGSRDLISDFTHLSDKIDLSAIDANGAKAGATAFIFQSVKGAAFTGVAGQLHYNWVGGATIVEGDLDGDKAADFQIQLTGSKVLTAGDFVL